MPFPPGQIEFWSTLLVQIIFFWIPALAYIAFDYIYLVLLFRPAQDSAASKATDMA